MLTQPGCQPCMATARKLDQLEVSYESVDISKVAPDHPRVVLARELGYASTPVVLVEEGGTDLVTHWSGYKPDHLAQLKGRLF